MPTTQLINPATFLDPASVTVVTLLSSTNYIVPDYQRDYSWTEEEVQKLWDDLVATAAKSFTAHGAVVPNPVPHFLGPIVLQVFPSNLNQTPEVMDGQQRLVTLTALFSVLCEFAEQLTQQQDRDIWTQSLKQLLFTHLAGQKVPKLRLARDDQFYQELVCNRFTQDERIKFAKAATPQPEKGSVLARLSKCTEVLYKNISEYAGLKGSAARDDKIIKLLRTAMELNVVLQMKVLELGVAYEIFETLNARGLDLQQADLIKNKLYSLAQNQGSKAAVKAAWERIVAAMQQQSMVTLTEFLFFHLIAKHQDAKLQNLYAAVILHLDKPGVTAKDYAEDLAKVAEAIQQILDAGSSFIPAVARDIDSIRDHITNKYALTLLIAGVSRHLPDSTDMAAVIKLTHHYVFRRFVVGALSVGVYGAEISKVAREYSDGVIPDLKALALRLESHSTTVEFEAQLKKFSAPSNKVGFYVIEMIENHIAAGAGVHVQRQSASQHLEHVMPKKPNSADWGHVTGDPAWGDSLSRMGNLLILEQNINGHIKNKAFAFKDNNARKLDYQHSKMTLPKLAKNYLVNGQWTLQSIERRQEDLVANYASRVWGLSV